MSIRFYKMTAVAVTLMSLAYLMVSCIGPVDPKYQARLLAEDGKYNELTPYIVPGKYDPQTRVEAIELMSDSPKMEYAVIGAASDPNEEVRRTVSKCLGKYKTKKSYECLVRLIDDHGASVRVEAIKSLTKSTYCGDHCFFKILNLFEDDSLDVRLSVAELLKERYSSEARKVALSGLDSPVSFLRIRAVRLLGETGNSEDIALLARLSQSNDIALSQAATIAIHGLSAGAHSIGHFGDITGNVNMPSLNQTGSAPIDRWAVVIGISDYKYGGGAIPDLRYAHRDAEAFYDFLLSENGGGFKNDHVLLLTDKDATYSAVRNAFFNFLRQAVREDLVVVFIAAHGAPDPKRNNDLYLITHDTNPQDIASTAFPMWDLGTALQANIEAGKVVVFADTCHSAAFGTNLGTKRGGRGQSNQLLNTYLTQLARAKPGRLVFTSSEGYESSFEDLRWGEGHGIFTYALLEGLKGAADSNTDKIVTLGELLDYVDLKVRRETGNAQHPSHSGAFFDRNLPMSVLQ